MLFPNFHNCIGSVEIAQNTLCIFNHVNFIGIGRDIALQLARCGAKVIAAARNKQLLGNRTPKLAFFTISPGSVVFS